jgi:hypothetical protein
VKVKLVKLFLRLSIGVGFLSAVADRFGLWSKDVAVWGNWDNFLRYTRTLNPVIPPSWIPFIGWASTLLEIVLGICLLIGLKNFVYCKTEWMAFTDLCPGNDIFGRDKSATRRFRFCCISRGFWVKLDKRKVFRNGQSRKEK